jgi:YfiH family protein
MPGILTARILTASGFRHGFPERSASPGALAAALGLGPGQAIVQVKQVHGGDAVDASEAGASASEGDALVARAAQPPIAVGVRVADCVPILVGDDASGRVAAIHAGWRGVTRRVVAAAVERLGGGARLVAAIGPCIGPCCFEVGADVAAQIAAAAHGADVVVAARGGKAYVDLRAAVRAQLVAAGLRDDRVEDVAGCTKHEAGRFHSFRRDAAQSDRMLAAIATRAAAHDTLDP